MSKKGQPTVRLKKYDEMHLPLQQNDHSKLAHFVRASFKASDAGLKEGYRIAARWAPHVHYSDEDFTTQYVEGGLWCLYEVTSWDKTKRVYMIMCAIATELLVYGSYVHFPDA